MVTIFTHIPQNRLLSSRDFALWHEYTVKTNNERSQLIMFISKYIRLNSLPMFC